MLTLLSFLIIITSTVAASYAHGRGDDLDGSAEKAWYETKGLFVAIHASLISSSGFYLYGNYGAALGILSFVYWFLFRTGKQAKAELDYMARNERGSYLRVIKSYLMPISICTAVSAALFAFSGDYIMMLASLACIISIAPFAFILPVFRIDAGERASDNRYPVELANGLCGGVNISILFISLGGLIA